MMDSIANEHSESGCAVRMKSKEGNGTREHSALEARPPDLDEAPERRRAAISAHGARSHAGGARHAWLRRRWPGRGPPGRRDAEKFLHASCGVVLRAEEKRALISSDSRARARVGGRGDLGSAKHERLGTLAETDLRANRSVS